MWRKISSLEYVNYRLGKTILIRRVLMETAQFQQEYQDQWEVIIKEIGKDEPKSVFNYEDIDSDGDVSQEKAIEFAQELMVGEYGNLYF